MVYAKGKFHTASFTILMLSISILLIYLIPTNIIRINVNTGDSNGNQYLDGDIIENQIYLWDIESNSYKMVERDILLHPLSIGSALMASFKDLKDLKMSSTAIVYGVVSRIDVYPLNKINEIYEPVTVYTILVKDVIYGSIDGKSIKILVNGQGVIQDKGNGLKFVTLDPIPILKPGEEWILFIKIIDDVNAIDELKLISKNIDLDLAYFMVYWAKVDSGRVIFDTFGIIDTPFRKRVVEMDLAEFRNLLLKM